MADDSRYAAPISMVADGRAPAVGRPPLAVLIATVLIWFVALIDTLDFFRDTRQLMPGATMSIQLSIDALSVALLIATGIFVLRRRNWARWVLFAVASMRVLFFLQLIRGSMDTLPGVKFTFDIVNFLKLAAPLTALSVAAVLLLWPARRWFRRPAVAEQQPPSS